MKISKLFHWLYAILMMLPIIALGSAILINTFNNEAKNEDFVTHYRWQTNELNHVSDVQLGYIYHFVLDEDYTDDILSGNFGSNRYDLILNVTIYKFNSVYIDNSCVEEVYDNVWGEIYDYIGFLDVDTLDCPMLAGNVDSNYITYDLSIAEGYRIDFYGVVDDIGGFTNDLILNYVEESDYNEISRVEAKDVTNVFYVALDKVQTSPVFSWAYNSFLVAPFQYIMALFGMPSNHIVVELLSYWLAVSIIWLVFDLIMYVPLLAHRWLDKGIIE